LEGKFSSAPRPVGYRVSSRPPTKANDNRYAQVIPLKRKSAPASQPAQLRAAAWSQLRRAGQQNRRWWRRRKVPR